jgi:hypothetical protein
MNIDFGYVFWNEIQSDTHFHKLPDEEKKEWLRRQLNMYIAHEYTHVATSQIMDPLARGRWSAAEDFGRWDNNKKESYGDRQPHATHKWWIESFATMLPLFMGFKFDGDWSDFEKRIEFAFNDIYKGHYKLHSLTAEKFSDIMMYKELDGQPFNANPNWAYLVTAYLAQRTSWKTILVDFIYDSQRVKKSRLVFFNEQSKKVPDLDNLWLHHFGKKQKDLLQDIFAKIINGEITMASLIDILPGGSKFVIDGLSAFEPQVVYSK